jgi:hypothetical protein
LPTKKPKKSGVGRDLAVFRPTYTKGNGAFASMRNGTSVSFGTMAPQKRSKSAIITKWNTNDGNKTVAQHSPW